METRFKVGDLVKYRNNVLQAYSLIPKTSFSRVAKISKSGQITLEDGRRFTAKGFSIGEIGYCKSYLYLTNQAELDAYNNLLRKQWAEHVWRGLREALSIAKPLGEDVTSSIKALQESIVTKFDLDIKAITGKEDGK